jgi:hypothetical protein
VLEKSPKDSEMSDDVSVARSIIDDAFDLETRGRARVIALTYEAVKRVEARLPRAVLAHRPRRWTERRVRSIVDREAGRIDHYEIQDLTAAAVEEARLERLRIRARDARLEAIIASEDTRQDQQGGERLGRGARGLDLPRSSGTDADADFNQDNGWGA